LSIALTLTLSQRERGIVRMGERGKVKHVEEYL